MPIELVLFILLYLFAGYTIRMTAVSFMRIHGHDINPGRADLVVFFWLPVSLFSTVLMLRAYYKAAVASYREAKAEEPEKVETDESAVP